MPPAPGGRTGWPEADGHGRTAAWPGLRPGGEGGYPPEAGGHPDPAPEPGSWFDKGHPAGPAAEAETRFLPGPAAGSTGSAADSPTGADTERFGPAGTGPLRVQVDDPWQNDETRGTHDPHEVTIQLDAVELSGPSAAAVGTVGGKEADRPVFVDESGRRSRRFRRLGMAVGLACAVYAVVIVVTLLSGNAAAPWVPIPVPGADDTPASKVKESPHPTESADPSADASDVPDAGADPSAPSAGVNPAPGTTAAPGTSARPGTTPDASTTPEPSASSTKKSLPDGTATTPPAPGAGGSTPGGGSSSSAPPPVEPDPGTPPTGGPGGPGGPGNTGGPGGTGATTNNAGAAPARTPIASGGPATAQPGATPAQSPENVL
ncbi:hypothetical protein ACFYNZ_24460 [Streptomyces kebangsaanensis]|uniref:Translation initiation factor IF-2 n=1 Tax=Streptomyces kebangsaanensis TaxID=864058 RepID=A0ABW6KXI5_9ACTN